MFWTVMLVNKIHYWTKKSALTKARPAKDWKKKKKLKYIQGMWRDEK